MNERIEALSRQAAIDLRAMKEPDLPPLEEEMLNRILKLRHDYDQRLAELIVQDCLKTISDQTTEDTNEDFREGFSHGRKLAWLEIRRQFGVK